MRQPTDLRVLSGRNDLLFLVLEGTLPRQISTPLRVLRALSDPQAAIAKELEGDPTVYSLIDLTAAPIIGQTGQKANTFGPFNSWRGALLRSRTWPACLIHKPGPLSDYSEAEVAD